MSKGLDKLTTFLGWILLGYFVLETITYVVTGRLFLEGKILLHSITSVEPLGACYYTGRLLSITILPLYMIKV